jgi:hypothetical protein
MGCRSLFQKFVAIETRDLKMAGRWRISPVPFSDGMRADDGWGLSPVPFSDGIEGR